MLETGLVHRPYIDGLRALAVVLVIFFHMNPGMLPGGYLGVDIFFVISGFVITQALLKDYLRNKKIRIGDFYIKRFKRLYPALVVMVLLTTVAYIFFGFQWDTNLYIKSAVTSLLASSNLYFLFHGVNYFHQDLINPLLHTWSLGIEEQFYIVYPLVLAAGLAFWNYKKWSLRSMAVWITVFSLVSYLSFVFGGSSIFSGYYFPLARFWEIGIGCALFLFTYQLPAVRNSRFIFMAGLGLLLFIQIFQPIVSNVYIGTLLACLATSAVILGGITRTAGVRFLMEHPLMLYIGKLSYSLYLWHLPVIYFSNLYISGVMFYIVSIVGSFIFAVISYHCVEHPLRHLGWLELLLSKLTRGVMYASLFLAGAMLTLLVLYGDFFRQSINNTFNAVSEALPAFNYIESKSHLGERIQSNYTLRGKNVAGCSFPTDLTTGGFDIRPECLVDINNQAIFFLSGDSHASHLLPTLSGVEEIQNLYFERFPRAHVADSSIPRQLRIDTLSLRSGTIDQLSGQYSLVVHVLSFYLDQPQHKAEDVARYLDGYISMVGDRAKIILVAPTPVFEFGPSSCVLLGKHCSIDKDLDEVRRAAALSVLKELEEKYDQVYVYDPYEYFCPGNECIVYNSNEDLLLYMDDDHISVEASTALSEDFGEWLYQRGLITR